MVTFVMTACHICLEDYLTLAGGGGNKTYDCRLNTTKRPVTLRAHAYLSRNLRVRHCVIFSECVKVSVLRGKGCENQVKHYID